MKQKNNFLKWVFVFFLRGRNKKRDKKSKDQNISHTKAPVWFKHFEEELLNTMTVHLTRIYKRLADIEKRLSSIESLPTIQKEMSSKKDVC